MPWFRRVGKPDHRGVPDTPPANPDAVLHALSVMDAQVLIELARAALRDVGQESTYDGAGALAFGDARLNLSGVSTIAARAPRRSWRTLVQRHVTSQYEALAAPPPQTLDDARMLLLPTLRASPGLPALPPEYAEEVLPGIALVVALEHPNHVTEVLSAELIDRYGGLRTVMDTAMVNLRALPEPTISDLLGDPDRDDATVQLMTFEDFFGASRVLRLPELLAAIGVERPRHGVLVALPHRHLLAVHVIRGEGVVAALRALRRLAVAEFGSAPAPLSPHVFYCAARGERQQVTEFADDGQLRVNLTGPLAATLRELGWKSSF